MNESTNPETQNKCGWTAVYKAAFYGSVAGILLTIGVFAYALIVREHGLPSALFIINLPAHFLCKIFGCDTFAYHNSTGADLVDWIILPTLTNSLLFFLIGLFVWFLFSKPQKDSNNDARL